MKPGPRDQKIHYAKANNGLLTWQRTPLEVLELFHEFVDFSYDLIPNECLAPQAIFQTAAAVILSSRNLERSNPQANFGTVERMSGQVEAVGVNLRENNYP